MATPAKKAHLSSPAIVAPTPEKPLSETPPKASASMPVAACRVLNLPLPQQKARCPKCRQLSIELMQDIHIPFCDACMPTTPQPANRKLFGEGKALCNGCVRVADGNEGRESWDQMTLCIGFFSPSPFCLPPPLSLPSLSLSHHVARPSPPDIKKSYREAKRRAGVARPLCAMVSKKK